MTTDRSFEGINPVAGNVKNTELQRAGPQVVSERKRRGGGDLGEVARLMDGYKATPEVGKVPLGNGRSIDFGVLTDHLLNKELDYG
ncbi:MAG: hypothetical protein KDI90_02120 [Alphaproteobacteria bacterium]|nr:hypothetical protein [Alphaproteobacteria bacterium]MCB9974467.1 hypothetical protein [Rhodospirillales bacterium]